MERSILLVLLKLAEQDGASPHVGLSPSQYQEMLMSEIDLGAGTVIPVHVVIMHTIGLLRAAVRRVNPSELPSHHRIPLAAAIHLIAGNVPLGCMIGCTG